MQKIDKKSILHRRLLRCNFIPIHFLPVKRKYFLGNYNIADWFSIYRIAAVPLLLLLIFAEKKQLFTWFLMVSFLTDMVDGWLARRLKIASERGAKLDSVGDMLTLLTAISGLFQFQWEFIHTHAVSLSLLVFVYFLEMAIALWRYKRLSSFHTYSSKVSFFIQGVFILTLLFFGYYPWLFYISIVSGYIETAEEIILVFMLQEYRSDVKGIYWVWQEKKMAKISVLAS